MEMYRTGNDILKIKLLVKLYKRLSPVIQKYTEWFNNSYLNVIRPKNGLIKHAPGIPCLHYTNGIIDSDYP